MKNKIIKIIKFLSLFLVLNILINTFSYNKTLFKIEIESNSYYVSYEISDDETFPVTFDLRDVNGVNYITPTSDQGNEGICWAYASASLIETKKLIEENKGYNKNTLRISAKQMDYALSSDGMYGENPYGKVGFLRSKLTEGATLRDVQKMFALKIGGVSIDWDLVNKGRSNANKKINSSNIYKEDDVIYEADEMPNISIRSYLSDTEKKIKIVKKMIMEYGGVIGEVDMDLVNYNISKTNDFLIGGINSDTNHAVHFIGWDDNYEYSYCPGEISLTCPVDSRVTGTGAWLFKNSWGEYLPYIHLPYDTWFEAVAITEVASDEWDNSYVLTENTSVDNYFYFDKDIGINEKVNKLKLLFNAVPQHGAMILYSRDGSEYELLENLEGYSLPGLYTFDFSDKNIIVNDNSRFKVLGVSTVSSMLFTTNIDDEILINTDNITLNKISDKVSINDNYLDIFIRSEIRNINNGENIIYRIKNSNGEYLNNSDYEILYNDVYYNYCSPTIRLFNNIGNGYYEIETWYNDTKINASGLDINIIENSYYTVTFNTNGGNTINSQKIRYNSVVNKPDDPIKNGFIFKGWQLNGVNYDFNSKVTKDIILIAVWEKVIVPDSLTDILINNNYKIKDNLVLGFKVGDTVEEINTKFEGKAIIESEYSIITTGSRIRMNEDIYTIVIKGDLDGDGEISSSDLLKMRKHMLNDISLSGAYKEAGLSSDDTEISSLDLLRLRKYMLGEYEY